MEERKIFNLNKDVKFIIRDYNDEFDFMEIIIKKGTLMDGLYVETFDNYLSQFYLKENDPNVTMRIIQESELDGEIKDFYNDFITLEVNKEDVENIRDFEEWLEETKDEPLFW